MSDNVKRAVVVGAGTMGHGIAQVLAQAGVDTTLVDVKQDFVDKGLLPKERSSNCAREYEQVRRAFSKTVLPYIDEGLRKKVQAIRWIRPDDGK